LRAKSGDFSVNSCSIKSICNKENLDSQQVEIQKWKMVSSNKVSEFHL